MYRRNSLTISGGTALKIYFFLTCCISYYIAKIVSIIWEFYFDCLSTAFFILFHSNIILSNKIKLFRIIIIWANNWNFIKFLSFYYIIRFENLRYYRFPWISNIFKPAYIFSHYFYFHFIRFHYSTSELNDISFFFPLHVPQYVNQNETMQNIKRIKKKKTKKYLSKFQIPFHRRIL